MILTLYTWKGVAHKGMRHGPVGEHDRLNRCKQYPDDAMSASTKGALLRLRRQILQNKLCEKNSACIGMKQRKKNLQ